MIMKKLIYIFLLVAAFACTNETVEVDNDNPLVYIPMKGFSLNEIWALEAGKDNHYLSVYCSGLYDGADGEIAVGFQVDQQLITDYNADITQEYSGQVKELPADCYKINGTSVKIAKGENAAKIAIEFDVDKVKALPQNPGEYYAIPIRLTSTSKYALHEDVTYTNALYAVNVKEPLFYFYTNRNGQTTQDCKVVYGKEQTVQYMLASTGMPEGSYNVDVAYAPELLDDYVAGGTVIPESSFEIINPKVEFKTQNSTPNLEVKFKADGLAYKEVYYLPLTITNTSAYKADESRSTLIVKVQLKNEYEKTYLSSFNIYNDRWARTKAYSTTKSITSYDNDIVEMQMIMNKTIAGATSVTGTSTTFNDKYMRIRIIPTDDPTHYDIELIKVTDSGSKNSPASLELIPDKDSYYNSNREEFVLNYRWKDSKGYWMEVTETATSN